MTNKKLPKTYTMEERLEKLISGCSNTGDLSGECYPMYGVYDLVEEFINDELTKARAEEKIKTKKIVDDVKDSLYKIQRMGVIDFRGEKLEVITRYQAVNTINLSGLPYTSMSDTGRSN